MYDEVDSMLISVNVPKNLTNVSNGRLKKITELDDDTRTFEWFVTNPINNYGVNINIGDYVNFSEVYLTLEGRQLLKYLVSHGNTLKKYLPLINSGLFLFNNR